MPFEMTDTPDLAVLTELIDSLEVLRLSVYSEVRRLAVDGASEGRLAGRAGDSDGRLGGNDGDGDGID